MDTPHSSPDATSSTQALTTSPVVRLSKPGVYTPEVLRRFESFTRKLVEVVKPRASGQASYRYWRAVYDAAGISKDEFDTDGLTTQECMMLFAYGLRLCEEEFDRATKELAK